MGEIYAEFINKYSEFTKKKAHQTTTVDMKPIFFKNLIKLEIKIEKYCVVQV